MTANMSNNNAPHHVPNNVSGNNVPNSAAPRPDGDGTTPRWQVCLHFCNAFIAPVIMYNIGP